MTKYFSTFLIILCFGMQPFVQAEEMRLPDFTVVAKKAIPAVVSIQVKTTAKQTNNNHFFDESDFFQQFFGPQNFGPTTQKPQIGQGSGFIVSEDGYILTNNHVVESSDEITVILDDEREFKAKLIGHDPNTDVALIKIEATKLPYLKLANSDKLNVGEWVVAIGTPYGLQATLTVGVISARGRKNLDLLHIEDFIQTDAPINRGNSGGPLLNLNGEVIGLNTALLSGSGGYAGIGFAIPSNIAHYVMDQLLETGTVKRGYIGVSLQKVDHDLASAFNLDKAEGALVADVVKDSPAEKAGLQQGDIIQKYNGTVINNIASFRNAIALMKPGSKISLGVLRKGNSVNTTVEIADFPVEKAASIASKGESKLGIEVETLTPELAKSFGITDIQGVLVNKVDSNSIAALAGLKKGMQILAVNQKPINSPTEFITEVNQTPAGKPVLFLIKQGTAIRYISLRIG